MKIESPKLISKKYGYKYKQNNNINNIILLPNIKNQDNPKLNVSTISIKENIKKMQSQPQSPLR